MIASDLLKTLIPLDTLTSAGLARVAELAEIVYFEPGALLFREGDNDTQTYYLLEGEVLLDNPRHDSDLTVKSGTETARHPLARLKPRRYDGVAKGRVKLVAFDENAFDRILTTDQTAAYEVTEFEGEDPEWMFQMLAQPAFRQIPTRNLVALFAKLQPVFVQAGQVILRQGEPGDSYYIIKDGEARVSRKVGQKEVKLADIGATMGFGEEALLTGEPRNATVTMLGDGELMRLDKADFDTLLSAPLVHWVNLDQAKALMQAGAALLDVRLETEFMHDALPGSLNLPLYLLRARAATLDEKRKYILVCQTERRACSAAFLLSQRGFDVAVLRGGLNGLRGATA
jgi:CRP-like cAMP-binding protein